LKKDRQTITTSEQTIKHSARRAFTVRVRNSFFQQLTTHLRLLKRINLRCTKQAWIEDAIKEKFLSIKNLNLLEDIGDKFINIKLDVKLAEEIERKIEELRKIGINLNKKQLFLEAIRERLSVEEQEVNQKAQELLQQMISSPKTSS